GVRRGTGLRASAASALRPRECQWVAGSVRQVTCGGRSGADPPVMDPYGRHAVLAAALRRLAARLDGLGYPVADVELRSGSCALLVDRGGTGRGALLHAGPAAPPGGMLAGPNP